MRITPLIHNWEMLGSGNQVNSELFPIEVITLQVAILTAEKKKG